MLLWDQKFYRIKVVLKNGSYSYSKIISVKRNQNKRFNLVVSPSPFNDKLKLSFYCDKDQEIQISLIDLQGRVLVTEKLNGFKGSNKGEFNYLSSLSKSVYF